MINTHFSPYYEYDSLPEEDDIDYLGEDIEDYYDELYADNQNMFSNFSEMAEGLRDVLHEDYHYATPEEMEVALIDMLESMTPAEGFNFGKILSQIGKAGKKVLRNPIAAKIAKTALPIAGSTIGTFFGPLGTMAGGKLGQIAGQAFSSGGKRSPALTKVAQTSVSGGSAAAGQLLQLTQNPDMLKSLLSLALGSNGKKSISIGKGGPSVNVGSFANLLSTLSNQVAADAEQLLSESNELHSYLLDSEGNYLYDPANPEERARALYEVLSEAETQRIASL